MSGGEYNITVSGNGDTYTNTEGNTEAYSSTCITIDGNIEIAGGTFTLRSEGTAGKCIKADGEIVIGVEGTDGPVIDAMTSGERILESSGSGSGWPGWGWGDNSDYSNPKIVKAMGNLTINSGTLTLVSTKDGGEGLESKNTLTINGGIMNIKTVDDCINAASHVQINGGYLELVATGNDCIDSNGTLTFTGGTVIAGAAASPEECFDCDNNRFTITGGVLIGVSGGTSTPTASVCTQRTVINTNTAYRRADLISLTDSEGNVLVSAPCISQSNGSLLFISSPLMEAGVQYTVSTGGTVQGGVNTGKVTVGGKLSGATTRYTFTPTSMVTGGNSGGRPR